MATGAEPAPPTAEGQKKLMVTVRAADTGEAFSQIATFQITPDDFRDYRTKVTEFTDI